MRRPRCVAITVTCGLWLAAFSVSEGQRLLSDGVGDLATQIVSSITQQQKAKVAVIPFRELDGRQTILGTYLSEALVTELFKRGGLEIVERTMLDRIMEELRLGESGLIDPSTARQVGQVAGVEAIITGTITDLQSFVAVNCRLIDVQTGRVFAAAETKIVKDDDVRKIMGVSMAAGRPPLGPQGTPGGTGGAPGGRYEYGEQLSQRVTVQNRPPSDFHFVVRLTSIEVLELSTKVWFLIEKRSMIEGRKIGLLDPPQYAYIVDENGRRYAYEDALGFPDDPPLNVPVRFSLQFAGLDQSARKVTLVFRFGNFWVGNPEVVFREVGLR